MTFIELLRNFVEGKISVHRFEVLFLQKFKAESSFIHELEFKVLDKLFADVDAYFDSTSSEFDSEYNVSEKQLKESAQETLDYLLTLEVIKSL